MLGHTGRVIGLCLIGLTLHEVVEAYLTRKLGYDDGIEGIPLGDDVAAVDYVAALVIE